MKKAFPWERAGIALAVVTLGGSQIFFNIVRGNRDHFPSALSFHAWVVVWVQLLPALVLFGLDTLLTRDERGTRLWRSFLYALTAVLVLRQAQIYYAAGFYALLPSWAALPAYAAAAAGVFLLAYRFPAGAGRYVAVLGLLGPLLAGQYLLGAWSRPAAAAETADAGPPHPGPPVVLLVFDEWGLDTLVKDGAIDRARFPRVAAIADEGAWFPEAISNHSRTEASVLTMFTGRVKPEVDVPTVFDRLRDSHRVTLQMAWPTFRLQLRERAAKPGDRYLCRTDAEAFRLGPLDVLTFMRTLLIESDFYAEGWTSPNPARLPPPDLWDIASDVDVLGSETASFLDLVDREAGPGRVLYWHCSLPHAPFRVDAEGRRHGRPHDHFEGPAGNTRAVYANYLEAARGVDRLVGLVADRLKARGLYDRTLLIVTSDHGARSQGAMPAEGEIRIPFLARGPSIRPGIRDADYQHIDFAPTLLDLLGAPAEPGAFEGRSAFGAARDEREARFDVGLREQRRARPGAPWTRVTRE
ncbi:MAG TPA: sulfatase-like hydrolase/transferase [Planctomycetota bacterium]